MSKKARSPMIEIFMPKGMKLFIALYWTGGLIGMMLGMLVFGQGLYESFWDIQILMMFAGAGTMAFGSLMFMLSGALWHREMWSLNVTKIATIALVAWSITGAAIGGYVVINVTGLDNYVILYGTIGWLLGFGVIAGMAILRYLTREGKTLRKYVEYTPPESLTPVTDERKLLPEIKRTKTIHCIDCGSEIPAGSMVCPNCGAPITRRK